jgi:hypothetical protein
MSDRVASLSETLAQLEAVVRQDTPRLQQLLERSKTDTDTQLELEITQLASNILRARNDLVILLKSVASMVDPAKPVDTTNPTATGLFSSVLLPC